MHRTLPVFAAALMLACVCFVRGSAQQASPVPAQAGTGFIAGQVIDSVTKGGIAGATVTLLVAAVPGGPPAVFRGPNFLPQPVIVDAQGRFFFASVPPGGYSIQTSRAGYAGPTTVAIPRVLAIGPGERISDLKIRLVKLAAIAGTVRDDAGDPVVSSTIVAFRRSQVGGRPTMQVVSTVQSDDRGAYRIPGLQPGEYVVCACAPPPLPLDGVLLTSLAADPVQLMSLASRALKSGADAASVDSSLRTAPPTFYPSSSTAARATRVRLAAGDEKAAMDIDVTIMRATRVSGTVVGAESPLGSSSVWLVPAAEGAEGMGAAVLRPMLVQPDGRFDFVGVPPGQYVLRVAHNVTAARGGGPSGTALQFLGGRASSMAPPGMPPIDDPLRWAAEPISVGENGLSGVTIDLHRGTRVRGRIEFVGSTPQPSAEVVSAPTLQPLSPNLGPAPSITSSVNADLTFQTSGRIPGRYAFLITAPRGWTTLKSIVIGGQDVTDLPVDLDTSDVNDVVITFTDAPAASLDVKLSNPSADEDLSILLFPSDRRYWAEPAAARRRFKSVPLSRVGAATIQIVPSGDYYLAVVPDDAAAEWQEMSQLESLARTAQRVMIADGEKKAVEIRR